MKTPTIITLCLLLTYPVLASSQAIDDASVFKPYKNIYLIASGNQGSEGDCDAKVQLSFYQNWVRLDRKRDESTLARILHQISESSLNS